MAIEVERMVATLEARIDKYEKNLVKASATTDMTFNAIENRGTAMAERLNRVTGGASRGFTQVNKAAQSLQGQTGNLASQFNDIAVQLAGGQNPFLIAIQQGTQITQVLGGAGASGAVSALGSAFASMLNPVSLATIAIIGLGGAAVQYFTSVLTEGEETSKVLKQQADLIQQVAARWGDAVPALREYADELKRAQESASLQEGVGILSAETLAGLKSQAEDVRIQIAALVQDLRAADADGVDAIVELQNAFEAFSAKADEGKLSTEDVERVTQALTQTITSSGIPAIAEFSTLFQALAKDALSASQSVQELNRQTALARSQSDPRTWRSAGITDQSADGRIQGSGTILPDVGPSPDSRPLIELDGLPGSHDKQRAGSMSAAEKQKKAIDDVVAALRFEQEQIVRTANEQELFNRLKQAGVTLDSEAGRMIALEVSALQAKEAAVKSVKDAQDAAKRSAEEWLEFNKSLTRGVIDGFLDGASAADVFADSLRRIGDRFLDLALDQAFSGSGLLGSLFGAKPAFNPAGKVGLFANGTNYAPGGAAIVGERGPELVNLPRGSQVIANRDIASAARGGNSVMINFSPAIDARGADAAGLARVEGQLQRMKAEMPVVAERAIVSARKRGVRGV